MKMAVTGHRPNKLYGYDLNDIRWISLKEKFKNILLLNNCDEGITGMALGVDTVYAIALLDLKAQGYDIKLHCAVPCLNQECKWNEFDKKLYKYILSRADEVVIVSNIIYKPWVMQVRNEYMVDRCDKLIAVWDGSSGGTANCVRYAESKNKEIIRIGV